MSTLVLLEHKKPEKGLLEISKWKGYLSKDQREEILEELRRNNPHVKLDDYIITMHVEIEMKKYDSKNT